MLGGGGRGGRTRLLLALVIWPRGRECVWGGGGVMGARREGSSYFSVAAAGDSMISKLWRKVPHRQAVVTWKIRHVPATLLCWTISVRVFCRFRSAGPQHFLCVQVARLLIGLARAVVGRLMRLLAWGVVAYACTVLCRL